MLKKIVFALAVLSSTASAETLVCPVGGERFEAPDIALCGAYVGQTMLLMSIGCPPDPIPQCPQNFLPMYKAFSAEEMPLLKQYMQTESYESIVDFSPNYLAFNIEKYLNGPNEQLPGLLLYWGLGEDPSLISDDPDYMVALAGEIEAQLRPMTPENNALTLAMLAFTKLLSGDVAAGRGYLKRAEIQSAGTRGAQAYLSAVRACFEDIGQPHCRPDAAIPQL